MSNPSNKNALSNDDARALAYFAVGVGSEGSIGGRDVSNRLSFAGKENGGKKLEPVGNSGYSLGTLQTDLGAHPEVAQPLVAAFQGWAKENHPEWALNQDQQRQRLQTLVATVTQSRSSTAGRWTSRSNPISTSS